MAIALVAPARGHGASSAGPRAGRRGEPWRVAALLAGLLLSGVVRPSVAEGHAKLIRSRPQAFEVLAAAPTVVELWFNERLEDAFSAIEVTDASGRRLDRGPARVDRRDRTHLTVPLGEIAPGSYVISWRVLSLDGHPARGRLMFTLK